MNLISQVQKMKTVLEEFTRLLIGHFADYSMSFEDRMVIFYFEEGNASQYNPYEAPAMYACSICYPNCSHSRQSCEHHYQKRHTAKKFQFRRYNFTYEELVKLITDEFSEEFLQKEYIEDQGTLGESEVLDEIWSNFIEKIDEKFKLNDY